MTSQLPVKEGSRVTADWLPGPCVVQAIVDRGSQVLLVFMAEETGISGTRTVTPQQITQLQILSGRTEDLPTGDPALFRLGVEAKRLGFAHSYDPYFALSVSRVDPLPHQLEAVYMHMLKQPRIRFLLGDDAGAGKTIMAGLLIRELRLRGLANRILIVSPANLCYQWRRELLDLFHEQFEWIKGEDVSDAYASNPWTRNDRCIVSRDWAKMDKVKDSLEEAERWDLIIIDEAHGMATTDPVKSPSERYKLARLLSQHTDHLLMMTATPHNGDKERFRHFLALLDPDAYGDSESLELAIQNKEAPFYLRRLKEAMRSFPTEAEPLGAPLFTKRTVNTVPFDIVGDEWIVYQRLTDYIRSIADVARRAQGPQARALGFMMALYQRRLASSPHALLRSLERRHERLKGILDGTWQAPKSKKAKALDAERAADLDDETLAGDYDALEDQQFSEYERRHAELEIQLLEPLIRQARELVATGTSAKWVKLEAMLESGEAFDAANDRKLLVFTEHKDTLVWLNEKLKAKGYSTVTIHGGMKPGGRDEPNTRLWAEQQFREADGAQVLVATEAAGEGINLQFCWKMVNWDVPWNPARLEQRIGRIHRYKQMRDVIAFNLIAQNTREGCVLEALQEKIDEIRRALDPDNEGKVFDVLGAVIPPSLVESVMKQVYEGDLDQEQAAEVIRSELTEEKFRAILEHTLESLASRELNMGVVRHYNAEAKLRRLVPEVLRDFFVTSAEVAIDRPVTKKDGYFAWKTPKQLLDLRGDLKKYGELGKEYRAFTFEKKDLDSNPNLEWITPGHALYEGVRRVTTNVARPHLSAGARFFDPEGGPSRWLQVFQYKLLDGNGAPVDEQLIAIELKQGNQDQLEYAIRPATMLLDLVPGDKKEPVPALPSESAMHGAQRTAYAQLDTVKDAAAKERFEQATKIHEHVKTSLQALINNELERFDQYERLQDQEQCRDRIAEYERRLRVRTTELRKQGHVVIESLVPVGLAYIQPMPIKDAGGAEAAAILRRDDAVEKAAVAFVRKWELEHGAAKVLSREVDGVGYDLESFDAHGNLIRFIEVKGKTSEHDGILTPNEWSVAERIRHDYWLYVVENPATKPVLHRVQDPFMKLHPTPEVKVARYFFDMGEVRKEESA